jgi:hypothetical protein
MIDIQYFDKIKNVVTLTLIVAAVADTQLLWCLAGAATVNPAPPAST